LAIGGTAIATKLTKPGTPAAKRPLKSPDSRMTRIITRMRPSETELLVY
jgi:hypothetical protein